jgi:hypothetical protein
MKKIILGIAVATATLLAGSAMAQPYGYRYDRSYDTPRYDSRYGSYRDSDGDGISDRAEWGRDRDRDGRPDQWDRYDNRRDYHWRGQHRRHHHDGRYGAYDRYDRNYRDSYR